MHLHEQHHGVQQQTDLRGPRPVQPERHNDPKRQPHNLVDALNRHASPTPAPDASHGVPAHPAMQRQADGGGGDHEEVGNGQVPQLVSEEAPDLDAQGVSGVLPVAQHGGDAHDGQADPEEVEEAMEVAVVAGRVEVGDARGEFDGWEDATALFGADELAGGGEGFGRGGSVV